MDAKTKHAELTASLQDAKQLQQRALRAADDATLQIARLEGALSIVTELLKDAHDG
jgi:hypothetical protein